MSKKTNELTAFLVEQGKSIILLEKAIIKLLREKNELLSQRKWTRSFKKHLQVYDIQIMTLRDKIEALKRQILYAIETGKF